MTRTMKDSGVEWIGEVPEQWILAKLKYNCSGFQNGSSQTQLNSDISNYPVTRIETISTGKIDFDKVGYVENINNNYLLKKNDFLISNINSIANLGNNAIFDSDRPLYHGMNLLKITPKFVYPKFLYYYFNSGIFRTNMQILCKPAINQASVSASNIKNIKMPFPPLPEQQAIADYLDDKCAQIDNITATINEQIDVLKQYKKSVITEAVTKGLDPNVPMKDSGVEWIGQIPEKWKVKKTLYCLQMPLTDGPHETPTLYDEGIPFISAEAIANESIDFSKKRGYISEEYYKLCCKKYKPELLDIYMVKSGATTGKTAIVETTEIFTIWSPLAVFRANKDIIMPYYLYYFIKSNAYLTQIETNWTYGTQQNIGMRSLERLKICVPPIFEQKAIVNYLDDKCAQIDSVIADKQAQLETLAAYKKSLIYEYVTGKKSVPGFEEA